jgi:hypothetical protein
MLNLVCQHATTDRREGIISRIRREFQDLEFDSNAVTFFVH